VAAGGSVSQIGIEIGAPVAAQKAVSDNLERILAGLRGEWK
jgi:hypothetical protein